MLWDVSTNETSSRATCPCTIHFGNFRSNYVVQRWNFNLDYYMHISFWVKCRLRWLIARQLIVCLRLLIFNKKNWYLIWALSIYNVQRCFIKKSKWTDDYGPYSQINSFRNRNVFSNVLNYCTLSACSLDVVGEPIPKAWCILGTEGSLIKPFQISVRLNK